MKKKALTALCLLCLLLCCACGAEENPADPGPAEPAGEDVFITFRSEITTADIWLLPRTEQNLHSSLWGTATLPQLAGGTEAQVSLTALGGPGVYILRAIDENEIFYEADELELEAGYTLCLSESDDPWTVTLEVTDSACAPVASYDVFAAAL